MGLFKKKKKEKKPVNNTIQISTLELIKIIRLADEAIDDSQIEYDLPFKSGETSHVIGIDYNRDLAPKNGLHREYISYYLDDQIFISIEDLCQNAELDGYRIMEYPEKITIDSVFKEVLESGDIESHEGMTWYGYY